MTKPILEARVAHPQQPDREPDAGLREKLAALEQLNTTQLRMDWRRLYGAQPPRLSRDLLIRGSAHRLQELQLGGMSKAARRKLTAFAKELEASGSLTPSSTKQVRPGARLVREWGGHTHTVVVLEEGFEYRGSVHRSLTGIAQAITGTHWSGPRFFGLIDKTRSSDTVDDETGIAERRCATPDRAAGGANG